MPFSSTKTPVNGGLPLSDGLSRRFYLPDNNHSFGSYITSANLPLIRRPRRRQRKRRMSKQRRFNKPPDEATRENGNLPKQRARNERTNPPPGQSLTPIVCLRSVKNAHFLSPQSPGTNNNSAAVIRTFDFIRTITEFSRRRCRRRSPLDPSKFKLPPQPPPPPLRLLPFMFPAHPQSYSRSPPSQSLASRIIISSSPQTTTRRAGMYESQQQQRHHYIQTDPESGANILKYD